MSAHSACLRVGFLQYTFLRPGRAFLLHFGARQHSARSKRAAQGQGQLKKPLPRRHQLRPDNMSLPCGLPVRSTQVAEPPPVGDSSRSSSKQAQTTTSFSSRQGDSCLAATQAQAQLDIASRQSLARLADKAARTGVFHRQLGNKRQEIIAFAETSPTAAAATSVDLTTRCCPAVCQTDYRSPGRPLWAGCLRSSATTLRSN